MISDLTENQLTYTQINRFIKIAIEDISLQGFQLLKDHSNSSNFKISVLLWFEIINY